MEICDQDSHLALIAPIVYISESALHAYEIGRIFTGDRATGQSQEYWSREVGERKHPFSPFPVFLLGNCSGIHQSQETCHRVSTGARGGWERGGCWESRE